MYDIFTQPYTSSMRTHRHSKLLRHQQHTQYLCDSCKSTGVNLANIDGICLQKLLKYHAIMCVFACGDSDAVGLESAADSGMAKDVIGGGRFLDEPTRRTS
jgi:hypothetical protein